MSSVICTSFDCPQYSNSPPITRTHPRYDRALQAPAAPYDVLLILNAEPFFLADKD